MQIWRGFWLVAAASVLAACASQAPTNSTAGASAASDTAKSTVPKGYRRVVKQGTEYFCRSQAVTGSHTLKTEICLTQDELDAEHTHSVSIGSNPHAPGS
jgi:hypothetical protein